MVTTDPFFKDGTWDVYFGLGVKTTVEEAPRVAYAIISIKHELIFNGIPQSGMNLDSPEVGNGTVSAIKQFQTKAGVTVDGVVGPVTAKALWRKRLLVEEKRVGAPPMLLVRQVDLESSNDPACLSADGQDRGPSQINEKYHPEVDTEEAFTTEFAFRWQANYMRLAYDHVLNDNDAKDWMLALAAYNVGWVPARAWDRAGRPPNSTAGRYIAAVLARRA